MRRGLPITVSMVAWLGLTGLWFGGCGEAPYAGDTPTPDGGTCKGSATCPSACQSDEECPGPPDPKCGVGRCIEGACTLEVLSGPMASQRYGDCQTVYCTPDGHPSPFEDPSDFYDDGRPCTLDRCQDGVPLNEPFPPGSGYPVPGETGICYEGQRYDCIVGTGAVCTDPNLCLIAIGGQNGEGGYCAPYTCLNNVTEENEGAKDCGGICKRPCIIDSPCKEDSDCISSVCSDGPSKRCLTPTCFDSRKNGDESGVDCGGASTCGPCPDGRGCLTPDDCASGVCKSGQCQMPTCFDAVQNGKESGVDCGGDCDLTCP